MAAMIAPLVHPLIKDEFKAGVDAGRLTLWKVEGEGWQTWLVTKIIQFQGGHVELVLEVIAGSHARQIVRTLQEKVKPLGVNSMLFETHHPEKVAARLVGCLGFKRTATKFRAQL